MNKRDIFQRVGSLSQFAGSYKYSMADGRGKDTSMVRVRNGSGLDFNLIPDKCMDIFDLSFKGIQLAWISKNGLVANHHFEDEDSLWLRSFGGGLLVTCGLRNVGPPVMDGNEKFGLHGRISGLPAQNVSIKNFWEGDNYCQEISGEIRESNVFGENMIIYRNIRVNSNNSEIELIDKIVNEGFERQQLMILYHINWGFPLLSADTRLILDSSKTSMRGEDQSEVKQWNQFSNPIQSYNERVYFHDLKPDEDNKIFYQINNPVLGLGVKVSWNKGDLPFLSQWKMFGKSEYVLGMEPGNCTPIGRIGIRESGNAEYLESFQEKVIRLKFNFFSL